MNNFITLTSGEYSALINPFGAELCSLKNEPTETEFVWQADKDVWPRHAPVLFPFVGRLKNFEYRYNGKVFSIEQHGFARDLAFKIILQTQNRLVLELTENAHTLQRYPFLFSFKITYELNENSLIMGFEVVNKGNAEMPVSFGGHPAFNITEPDDAVIVFENDPDPKTWKLDENFISNRTQSITDGFGKIEVNDQTFARDALIFKNLNSKWVKLISKTTGQFVKVDIEGWPYLGIWAKPGANYICIEPWQGLADSAEFEGEVSKKEGILMLGSGEKVEKHFKIGVGYSENK